MGATVELLLPARLTDDAVRRLCTGLREQLGSGAVTSVVCRVDRSVGDHATADAVARLALVARRAGVAFSLDGTRPDLSSLLALLGLGAAVAGLPDD